AGAHGKSTTAAMLALALGDASACIGAIIAGGGGTGARWGSGPWFVAEADESDRSLLRLAPQAAILTNVEHDHPPTLASPPARPPRALGEPRGRRGAVPRLPGPPPARGPRRRRPGRRRETRGRGGALPGPPGGRRAQSVVSRRGRARGRRARPSRGRPRGAATRRARAPQRRQCRPPPRARAPLPRPPRAP